MAHQPKEEVTHEEAWFPLAEDEDNTRAVKARRQEMTVKADVREGEATGTYKVESESGNEYKVNIKRGECECADHQFSRSFCKHQRRVELCLNHTDLVVPGERIE